MATFLQWPLSFEDSPYTDSCLNLSGHCGEVYLFDWQYLAFSGYRKCLPNLVNSSWLWRIFPGPLYRNKLSAQPLIWKWFFILMQIKLIFTRKFVHLASLWKWGSLELGSGLLAMGFEPIREGEIFWLNNKKPLLHRQTTGNQPKSVLQVKIKFRLKFFNLGWFSISFVS